MLPQIPKGSFNPHNLIAIRMLIMAVLFDF